MSNLKSEKVISDYRSYTYTFAVNENNGVSVYSLDGICYDDECIDDFERIMYEASASISIEKDR